MTKKLLQLWVSASLLCLLLCIALLFFIIAFSSVKPSPVSFSVFSMSFGPPVISHSSITYLRSSSFLLHSLHLFSPSSFQYSLALISFPHLLLWRYFCNVCYIWIPLSFPPLSCFSLASFFYNFVSL